MWFTSEQHKPSVICATPNTMDTFILYLRRMHFNSVSSHAIPSGVALRTS